MKRAIAYEIINHGCEHAQYFQGCGVTFTSFDIAVTGIGDNAKEAYYDAIEQCYQMDIDHSSLDRLLPKRPKGIRKRDKCPSQPDGGELYWHVSIRLTLINYKARDV